MYEYLKRFSLTPDPPNPAIPPIPAVPATPLPHPWQQLMLISEVMTLPARQNTPEMPTFQGPGGPARAGSQKIRGGVGGLGIKEPQEYKGREVLPAYRCQFYLSIFAGGKI